ncbi:unnamed protein product [Hermetia illucens]|uniref:Ionotropic receptor n=1 Tax=Hermetia illucens TaxID=343691 RepID=A0A7R8UAK3_HERIL|nr:unnamed protein product [Hermetia illucens]
MQMNNLFVFIISDDSDLLTKYEPDNLDVIQSAKTILWFCDKVENTQGRVLFYFEFMWKLGILNVVAMVSLDGGRGEILTFTPFPVFKIYELTPEQDFFPDKLKDLHGFPITTIIKTDEPRVFRYKDRHGNQRIGGYASKIFMSFLEKHNATLNEYLIPNDTYVHAENLINLVHKEEITISMHPYRQNGSNVDGSYPARMIKICIMYPAPAEVPADKYLLYSFSSSVWTILGFTAAYIVLTNLWLGRVIRGHLRVDMLLLDSFRALMSQSDIIWTIRKLWKYRMIRLSIVLFSFFISNAYQSLLAGILTTRVFERPVSTKAEMITAGLGIYIIDFEFGFYERGMTPQEFKNLFIPVDTETYNRHRNVLNTTYAYNTPDEKALFLMQQQKFLDRPLFIFSNVCLEAGLLGFLMPRNSPFKDAFNRVLLQCYQSGLYFKWNTDAFTEAVEAGILERFNFHTLIFPCPGLFPSDTFIKEINLPILFIVNSSNYDTKNLLSLNNLFIISIEGHQQDLQSISKCISKFLGILRHGKTILWINYIVQTPFEDTAPYFEYMWTKKVLDVVAIFDSESASNQVFTYNPFPTFKVENISGQRDIFPDKLGNLHGFPITTLIKRDEPRIFRYKDHSGRTKLGGYAAKIFLAFLKKHNATLEEYVIPNTTYLNVRVLANLVADGHVSISMHPYAQVG